VKATANRAWRALGVLLAAALIASPTAAVLPVAAAAADSSRARFIRPSYAAILIDPATREVLYSNNADELRHPASITKIMTMYLTFDALKAGTLSVTDRVPISYRAASQRPSRLGLRPGTSLSVDEAMRVIAVKSANDIAVALAEKIAGSEDAFAERMTAKARSLGMARTTFVNASGLPDPRHVTTARDLSILASALLRNHPARYAYFSQQKYSYEKQQMLNHNKLLGRFPGMDGIKTGYTADAGFTLAASATRGGKRLVAVVLGERTAAERDRDVAALLDTGFKVLDHRAIGQPATVAGLLRPLVHPAVRVTAPTEQGSADTRSQAKPKAVAKPQVRAARSDSTRTETRKGTNQPKLAIRGKAVPYAAARSADTKKAGSSVKTGPGKSATTSAASAKDKRKTGA